MFDATGTWRDAEPDRVRLARLFRRFELTIPLRRPVRVHFKDLVSKPQAIEGLPYRLLADVLYLQVAPDRLVALPRALVTDIKPVFPRGQDATAPQAGSAS